MTGPLPGYLAPVTLPASYVYGGVVAARNRRFDRGRGVGSVGLPVISVGNLTLGGTGKTPMVIWLAERLAAAGRRPVIAMRGYGARAGLEGSSDEGAVYAQRLPDVPVLADPDRLGALRESPAGNHPGGVRRVAREPEVARQDIAGAARDQPDGNVTTRNTGDGLHNRPIPAVDRHGIDVVVRARPRHAGCVTVSLRFHHLHATSFALQHGNNGVGN